MNIGYARVSKADGTKNVDFQIDALKKVGVKTENIYQDQASGAKDDRPGLTSCLKALRKGDTLFVWKLDRLGRSLKNLVEIIDELKKREIGLKVLTGTGAEIDTRTPSGKLIFGIFASLAEFERELIRERTLAGLSSARARGRVGGRKAKLSKAKIRLLEASMGQRETNVLQLCRELGISRQTIYRYVGPDGSLREFGKKILNS
jgi:DNA invertase Pin-like site-specific DNA recombinase